MRLVSWNVNGIRAVGRKGLFSPFVQALDADVICLQETKAEASEADLGLSGYHEYWNPALRRGYSGTALLTRAKPLAVTRDLPADIGRRFRLDADPFGNPNSEGRVITAEFDGLFVVSVYTPNAKDDLERLGLRHKHWDPAFLAYVKRLAKKKPVVFCGDLNVAHTPDDLARPKANVGNKGFTDEEREGFRNFLDAGFVDTFRLLHQGNGYYTWWTIRSGARERNVGWRIDYFLVSRSLAPSVRAAGIHPEIMGSDHCPISLDLEFQPPAMDDGTLPQPPAMAPSTTKGSLPLSTSGGRGASGESWERSSSQAK